VKSAAVPQPASGSANPVAAVSAAQTQNMRVSGNGVHAICPLSAASGSALEKGIAACLAAEEESA
jgi:hypothetical protein